MERSVIIAALRRLAEEIGWWASCAEEEAEAFRETFDAVVEYPLAARLVGQAVEVTGVVVWGEHLRAEVWAGERRAWVSLDALDFEPETLAARVAWALRLRVGWPVVGPGLPHFEGGPQPPPLGLGFAAVSLVRRIEALERLAVEDVLHVGEEAFAGIEALLAAGLIAAGEAACGRLGDALLAPRLVERIEDLEALRALWTRVGLRWLGLREGAEAETARRLGEWAPLARTLGVDVWAAVLGRADSALLEALDDYATAALECPGSLAARERWRRLAWESRLRRGALDRLPELVSPGALSVEDGVAWGRRLRAAGRLSEALERVEVEWRRHEAAGTRWSASMAALSELRRKLQAEVARQSAGVSAAWAAFEAAPTLGRLRAVLEASPSGERRWWFARGAALLPAAGSRLEAALALGASGPLEEQVGALRVVELASLEERLLVEIGRALGPGQARVKAELALAWQLLERGGRDHVQHAVEAVARAQAAVDDGTSRSLWEAVVEQLVGAHGRKRGLRHALDVLRGRR